MSNQTVTYTPVRLIALACFLVWAALAASTFYEIAQRGSENFFGSEMVFASAVSGVLAAAGAAAVWLKKPFGAALVLIAAVINHLGGVFSEDGRGEYNWGLSILSALLVLVVCVHSLVTDSNHV